MTTTSPGRAARSAIAMARVDRAPHNTATVVGGHPRDHGIDDGQRILRARVVGRDDHLVGEGGGDAAHLGTLLAVSITTTSEDHDHAALGGNAAAGLERPREPVGRVRVVDDDDERLSPIDRLEPTGYGVVAASPRAIASGACPSSESRVAAASLFITLKRPPSPTRIRCPCHVYSCGSVR